MLNWLGLPVAASTHAGEIDEMIVLVHWLMAILFVGWGLFFLYVLFRFRKSANPKASYAGAKGKISKGLEVAVAIVEVILLVFYAIPVWFIPNRVGQYEIACSQLCGLGHFRMRGFVTIQSAADYQKWFDDQEKEVRPATPTAP